MVISLSVWGWLFCLDANAQWGWNNGWWPPHRVQETIRTDTFKGEIASITNTTMIVRGHEVLIHRVRWSYAYTATEKPPPRSTSEENARETQIFQIPPHCRIFTADGDCILSGKLRAGKTVTVSYSVQTKGDRVADEITVASLKP